MDDSFLEDFANKINKDKGKGNDDDVIIFEGGDADEEA